MSPDWSTTVLLSAPVWSTVISVETLRRDQRIIVDIGLRQRRRLDLERIGARGAARAGDQPDQDQLAQHRRTPCCRTVVSVMARREAGALARRQKRRDAVAADEDAAYAGGQRGEGWIVGDGEVVAGRASFSTPPRHTTERA